MSGTSAKHRKAPLHTPEQTMALRDLNDRYALRCADLVTRYVRERNLLRERYALERDRILQEETL